MVISNNFLLNLVGIIIATVIFIILFYKKKLRYWQDLGIVCMKPTIPFGNASDILLRKTSNSEWIQNMYDYLKSKNVKHGGSYLFYLPSYVPLDLDLLKHILQTDFAYFTDRYMYVNEKDDPLTAHLFSLGGQRWRSLRTKLTPTFTSGKMKNMFPIMVQMSEELVKVLGNKIENGKSFEAKDISARFTTDIIANCAFGIECNSLAEPNTEFRVHGKRLFALTPIEAFLNFTSIIFPDFCRFFGVRILPKVAADFFWKTIKETVDYREQTGFKRNDAMQILIEMLAKDKNDSNENTLTFNEIAAQAFVFYIAGFETSSTLMSFTLLELAANQEVQDKLRKEINEVMEENDNELTYTALQDMKYLDMVINETLRKFPPVPAVNRICIKDYRVPNSDLILKKGTPVLIPIRAIHYDPEYYPNPEVFDPERFKDENINNRHRFAFLPFGEGPRACIGIRFGMMQAKIGLTAIIKNFRITVNPQTSLPVKLEPNSFLTSPLGELLLDLEKY